MFKKVICFALACVMLSGILLQSFSVYAQTTAGDATFLADDFESDLSKWNNPGGWVLERDTAASGSVAKVTAAVGATPKNLIAKTSIMPETTSDYEFGFSAKADDRFRAIIRYSGSGSAVNFYFFEFKAVNKVEMYKSVAGAASIIGQQFDISKVISGFNLTSSWHDYRIVAEGSQFTLYIDNQRITSFADSSFSAGVAGVSVKSRDTAATVWVDNVNVTQVKAGGSTPTPTTTPTASPTPASTTSPTPNPVNSYSNNFETETVGAAPSGWKVNNSAAFVVKLPDGNQVFNLNGKSAGPNLTAQLTNSDFISMDNFKIKFRAKYEKQPDAPDYNVWRLRYRAVDSSNNNCLEWGTHNSKYFIMRKTTQGGNYYLANYVKSYLNEWHEYELQIVGVTHRLFIDGVEVASADDADPLRLEKGYIEFGTVYGINLFIDDINIEKLPVPYVYMLQPVGDFSGLYSVQEVPGLDVEISSGNTAHKYTVKYVVTDAENRAIKMAEGEKQYTLAAYEKKSEQILFTPDIDRIGTYDVATDFYVDDIKIPEKSKNMRISVVNQHAPIGAVDLDMESKFGFNTHYKTNWRDDIIDGMRKTGARHHRSDISWQAVETAKGVYNYSSFDEAFNKLKSFGFNQIPIMDIKSNDKYQPGIATSAEALNGITKFVENTVNRYKGQIRHWEMPNEPELFFHPGSTYVPSELVEMQKAAYIGMKKADLDSVLIAGDHTSSVLAVLPKELELGSYDYSDAYSYHPYIYDAMPESKLLTFINGVKNLVNAYGGWKDYYLTEGGWPTAKAGYPSVSEEFQRDYIVRSFLIDMTVDQLKAWEYYDYKNDGTDDNHYDIFWGITDNDGRPKLAYNAVNNLMTTLDKVHYVGRLNTGDPLVEAHVFIKNYQPVIAAWKKISHKDNPAVVAPTSVLGISVENGPVTVRDINGNESTVNAVGGVANITVSGSPVYIFGAGNAIIYSSATILLGDKVQDAKLKMNAANSNTQELDSIKAQVDAALVNPSSALKAEELEQGITASYTLMKTMAGQIKRGEIDRAKGYVAMEALYNYAEGISKVLIQVKGQQGMNAASVVLDYTASVNAAESAYRAKIGPNGIMPVSTAAVMRSNRYGRLAETNKARGDYAESYAYNLLAREFAGVVTEMVASEPVKSVAVLLNVTPGSAAGEAGYANIIIVSLTNNSNAVQQAVFNVAVPEEWKTVQGNNGTLKVSIDPGQTVNRTYSIQIPQDAPKGKYTVGVTASVGGVNVSSQEVTIQVSDAIAARVLPVTKPVTGLSEITVELKGTSAYSKTGKVIVKGPDGKELRPIGTDTFQDLKQGQVATMTFAWDFRTVREFNEYVCQLVVMDTTTHRPIFSDDHAALDFNLIQKAGRMNLDGNLADWKDAYPVHIRGAARNNTGIHDSSNLEAVAYTKWDENSFHIAVEVTDNIHKNSEDASNMWKNDSVQISFDPLDDNGDMYKADDMEWGFSMNDTGEHLAFVFASTAPNPNGNVTGQVPFRVVRDEDRKKTYYEIQIPLSLIKDMKPELNQSIGFNVNINDADFQNGRDNFINWTKGLGDSKNPGLYDGFIFIEEAPPVGGTSPVYSVTAVENAPVYTTGQTVHGIKTFTVMDGISGMKYFKVTATPVLPHSDDETIIFTHWRNGVQENISISVTDIDAGADTAIAGFAVQPGDVVTVYVVDRITGAVDSNPVVLQ